MSWSPTSDVFGLEWPVTRQGGTMLSASADAAAASFTSSSAQTVTALGLYLSRVVGAPSLTLDVYPSGSLPVTTSTNTYRPNADDTVTSFEDEAAATSTIFDSVDEASLDTDDYVRSNASGATYRCQVGSAAHSGAASAIRVRAWVDCEDAGGAVAFTPLVEVGGTVYEGTSTTVAFSDGVTLVEHEWAENPHPDTAWTESDVQAFDAAGSVGFEVDGSGGRIYQLWMETDTLSAAPTAQGSTSVTADGWATFTLDSNWSKASATDYTLVLRKTNASGQCVWSALESGEACPHVSWASSVPTIESGVLESVGDSLTAAHAVTMTVSGSPSADSQPYATLTKEAVHSGRTVEQEFTPSATKTAGVLGAMVARQAATVDADLLLKVKRRSDDTQIGGTATITSDDVATAVRKLRQVWAAMASTGSATNGTQYYVEASSTATSGTGWTVAVLSTEGAGASAGQGGTTDAATVAGTQDTDTDAVALAGVAPATISGVGATESGSGTSTNVAVSWTASTDADFDHYEIHRGGTLIATESTKATTSFADYEARVGVQESYAVRQVLTDGRVSADSTAATVTVADDTNRLVTNHDSSLNAALEIEAPLDRTRHADRNEYEPLGADHVRVHRGSQDRGFELALSVEQTSNGDAAADLFSSLVAACEADVDHLCIVTGWGDRYFVTAEYEGDSTVILGYGAASVRFREVTMSPVES